MIAQSSYMIWNIVTDKNHYKHIFPSVIWGCSSQSTQQVAKEENHHSSSNLQKAWECLNRSHQKEHHRAAHVRTKDAHATHSWLPQLKMPRQEARRCCARLCRQGLLRSRPRPAAATPQPSAPRWSQLTNLAEDCSGLGAALTWDSQPPAGSSSGAADLCPPAKGWTIRSSKQCPICAHPTRNVRTCPCVQEHYVQAAMHFWSEQRQQLCLDFLNRQFSFFSLLGSCAGNSRKVKMLCRQKIAV